MNYSPDVLVLRIDSIAQGGAGVGRLEGQVVFVPGALPGEEVRIRPVRHKKHYLVADLLAVLEPSPDRIAPRLPGADHIPWQHITYAAQLRYKQIIVRDQLTKLANISEAPVLSPLPAAQHWSYRNTAHLHIQGAQVGYYAAGTRTVQPLSADPLLLPALNEALDGLRPLLSAGNWQPTAVTLRGSAAHGYAVGMLRGSDNLDALTQRWRARVPALADATVLDAVPPAVTLHEELGGITFVLSPLSFFQTCTAQAATLLDVVRELLALQPHERLLDAYSGVGTFALPLAHKVREVVAIEEHPQAVVDGRQSAALNDITNVQFIVAPVEHELQSTTAAFDSVILDPPRRGCHPAALDALARLNPARIVYVSCQPGILARDIQRLLGHGYHLCTVQPVDMFPYTPHIECVALLRRDKQP